MTQQPIDPTPSIHLHGCIIILGSLNLPPGAGEPSTLRQFLQSANLAVTQSYVRLPEPALSVPAPEPYIRPVAAGTQPEPQLPASRNAPAAPEARLAPPKPRAKRATQIEDVTNRCPICQAPIGPDSIGCRRHYKQVKKQRAAEFAQRLAEVARDYDEVEDDDDAQ